MTPAVPAALAAGAVLALAAALRPVPADRLHDLVPSLGHAARPRLGPLLVVGRPVRRVLGRPPDDRRDRRVGGALVVAVLLTVVLPPLAVLWLAVFSGASVLRRRRDRVLADRRLLDEMPEVVDLLALAISAGLTVPLAVGVVADRGSGRLAEELGRSRRSAELGTGLADALDEIPNRLGDQVRPLTRVLSGSLRDGTSLAEALDRLAHEVRTERRRSAEERARKVSVRLLFPLVCCVLPAFALLTLVPLLAGALSGIAF